LQGHSGQWKTFGKWRAKTCLYKLCLTPVSYPQASQTSLKRVSIIQNLIDLFYKYLALIVSLACSSSKWILRSCWFSKCSKHRSKVQVTLSGKCIFLRWLLISSTSSFLLPKSHSLQSLRTHAPFSILTPMKCAKKLSPTGTPTGLGFLCTSRTWRFLRVEHVKVASHKTQFWSLL